MANLDVPIENIIEHYLKIIPVLSVLIKMDLRLTIFLSNLFLKMMFIG